MLEEGAGVVRRVVLTGGPCAGKTTVQAMVAEAFQERGWKVYRVPETATVLLSGGVVFAQLDEAQSYSFQENLLLTMLSLERVYFDLAELDAKKGRKVLVLCDRGAMDPSACAYMGKKEKEKGVSLTPPLLARARH